MDPRRLQEIRVPPVAEGDGEDSATDGVAERL
jgi:hypothetical protein